MEDEEQVIRELSLILQKFTSVPTEQRGKKGLNNSSQKKKITGVVTVTKK